MAENLLQALTDIRQRLENQEYKNEEHVRFSLVGRVLLALGWNIWDPVQVCTEEKPHEGENHTKVDISLRVSGQKLSTIYIECKKVGMLRPHRPKVENQISTYNSKNQASLVILTDGRIWYLYYALGQAPFSDRVFAEYDLLVHPLEEVEEALGQVLNQRDVAEGRAKSAAEALWDRRRMEQKMEGLLAEARSNITQHRTDHNLKQELVFLMRQHGFPDTLEDDVHPFLERLKAGLSAKFTQAPVSKAVIAKAIELKKRLEQPSFDPSPREEFRLKGRGADAKAEYLPDGKMRVAEGALAAGTVTKSMPPAKKIMRDHLMQTGVLVPHENTLRFACEHTFRSPSEAAEVIYGNSINAREAWLHETTKEPIGKFMPKKSP